MADTAAVYAETRERLRELVAGLSEEELGTNVPATPAWSVRDVVAHLVGEARITNTGDAPPEFRLLESLRDPGQADLRDRINGEEVARRRDAPFPQVLEEWDGLVEQLMPKLRGEEPFPFPEPFLDSILVTDLAGHGQDIRGALDRPGERDSAACRIGLASFAVGLGFRLDSLGIPALRLRYDGKERLCGTTDPGATLTGNRFELFRALAGRRSRRQIEGLEWDGDREPYVPLIPAYGERLDDIVE
ncbi:MAG: maleylpyruvate isomerase family mycothiol-dependent enzyme [Actinomycetota bacterium]